MFLVKLTRVPPWARKSPVTMSLRRKTLGSNWICMGADARSAALFTATATMNVFWTFVSTRSGRNRTLAAPGAAPCRLAGAGAASPGTPGTGMPGCGGAAVGGAVAGGPIGEVVGGVAGVTGGVVWRAAAGGIGLAAGGGTGAPAGGAGRGAGAAVGDSGA